MNKLSMWICKSSNKPHPQTNKGFAWVTQYSLVIVAPKQIAFSGFFEDQFEESGLCVVGSCTEGAVSSNAGDEEDVSPPLGAGRIRPMEFGGRYHNNFEFNVALYHGSGRHQSNMLVLL